jgi:hypothetical protein
MKYLSTGLLWVAGEPDIYGQPTYQNPVSVRHRWEDKTGLFITGNGRQEAFKSRVYVDVLPKPGDRISKRVSDGLAGSIEIKDVREILSVSGKKREIRILL